MAIRSASAVERSTPYRRAKALTLTGAPDPTHARAEARRACYRIRWRRGCADLLAITSRRHRAAAIAWAR